MQRLHWLNKLPGSATYALCSHPNKQNFLDDPYDNSKIVIFWLSAEELYTILWEQYGPWLVPQSKSDSYTIRLRAFHENFEVAIPQLPGRKPNPYTSIEDYNANVFSSFDKTTIVDLESKTPRIYNTAWLKTHPIKMLEFLRLCAHLDYPIHPDDIEIIRKNRTKLKYLPNAEFGDLLRKVLDGKNGARFFELLLQTGTAREVMPHLYAASKMEQTKKEGVHTVAEHCILSYKFLPRLTSYGLKLAALYHDLGKVTTRQVIGDQVRFYGHEKVGAKWLAKDMKDWGFAPNEISRAYVLVLHHMFDGGPQLTDDGVRRLIKRVGAPYILDLIKLRRADSAGFVGEPTGAWKMDKLGERIKKELSLNPFVEQNLALTKDEIRTITGISKIEELDSLLNLLLNLVLFSTLQNTTSALTQWLTSIDFSRLEKFCPLGLAWLFEQQADKLQGTLHENSEGLFECGKHCNYACNNTENIWKV